VMKKWRMRRTMTMIHLKVRETRKVESLN